MSSSGVTYRTIWQRRYYTKLSNQRGISVQLTKLFCSPLRVAKRMTISQIVIERSQRKLGLTMSIEMGSLAAGATVTAQRLVCECHGSSVGCTHSDAATRDELLRLLRIYIASLRSSSAITIQQ